MSDSSDSELSDSEYVNLEESGSDETDENNDSASDSDTSSESDSETTLQNARMWCPLNVNIPNSAPPRYTFIGNSGCTFHVPDNNNVLFYFHQFFDDELLEILVTETNRYASQQPNTTNHTWQIVTKNEMFIFLAINILQGVIRKPTERLYWSNAEIFSTPIFSRLMSYRRYSNIKKNLHFMNNESYDPHNHPNPKLNKIWPVFHRINKKCSELYIPERDVAVDESLLLYKGRLGWVQYIPMKRSRFGIKWYLLCESKSGYLFSSIIYTGKGTLFDEKYKTFPISSQVVLTLMDPLLDMGYCVTTDNFYTSPQLADFLVQHKTDTYGTLRINRKEVPSELQKKKLKRNEIIAFQRGKVMTLKWKDKKDVCLLSTIHSSDMVETTKTDKDGAKICKPQLVVDYNNTMGGVDKLDQHLHDYPVTRKRGKKYYKKIFFHLLDICVWNSFILYQKNGGMKSHLDFRQKLVEEILNEYPVANRRKSGRPRLQPGPSRLTERHFPEFIPPSEKKSAPTRCCAVCCKKKKDSGKKIRKETRYFCRDCNVALCAVPCFLIYHTKIEF